MAPSLYRRAVAERAENIGIWFKILEMLAQLAVISNVSGQAMGTGTRTGLRKGTETEMKMGTVTEAERGTVTEAEMGTEIETKMGK